MLKIERLDFSFREHEGEVKAWLTTASQTHVFTNICCFFKSFFLNLHLKCAFANILLISFILNFISMFCICIVVELIFIDFRFYSFHLEICKLYTWNTLIDIKMFISFPYLNKNAVLFKIWQVDCFRALKKLQITQVVWKKIKIEHNPTINLAQESFVRIFLDFEFIFHLEFRQYKFRSLVWFFCLNKLNHLYCLNTLLLE